MSLRRHEKFIREVDVSRICVFKIKLKMSTYGAQPSGINPNMQC
jgi:hypothetical protein